MQTWHGNLLGKKCEKDAEDKLWPGYIPVAQYDGIITNAFIVANRQSLNLAKRSFWLNDKVEYLKIGAPSIAVSYTHLDVYKRQHVYSMRSSLIVGQKISEQNTIEPEYRLVCSAEI